MGASREEDQTLSSDLFCMRGIGILIVVFVHVLGVDAGHGVRKLFPPERTDLRVLVELFHSFNMAVMLIGSGVAVAAFGRADLTLSTFLRKKLNKLFIPMLVWAPVLFLMQELTRRRPQGPAGWLELLLSLPGAWFPPYSIFWFVHALVGCTLLAWLFRKYAAPRLGRWSEAIYFGLAILLYLAVRAWRPHTSGGLGEYLELILYWNRFFGLGLLVYPWLSTAHRAINRRGLAFQALLPAGFLALIVFVYAVLPAEQYGVARVINGPLGFCLLFSLAGFVRNRSQQGGAAWKEAWRRLVFTGSISMTIYLFHLYFVAGMRIALERLHPGTLLAVHLVLGCLAGCVGPWLLFRVFKGQPWFSWSVGLSRQAPRPHAKEPRPQGDDGLAPIPATPKL